MDKYHPGYFGKVGMRYFHLNKNKYWKPTVNVNKLWSLVGDDVKAKFAGKKGIAPVVNTLNAVSLI
jgi:large subunit ribosomal protein L27Ae